MLLCVRCVVANYVKVVNVVVVTTVVVVGVVVNNVLC